MKRFGRRCRINWRPTAENGGFHPTLHVYLAVILKSFTPFIKYINTLFVFPTKFDSCFIEKMPSVTSVILASNPDYIYPLGVNLLFGLVPLWASLKVAAARK